MLIKNLAAMCRKRLFIVMFSDKRNGIQWIGDGTSVFPMHGIPELDDEQIKFLFDIPEEKREKCIVSHMGEIGDMFDVSDSAADNEVIVMKPAMMINGKLLCPVSTSAGIAFFNPELLTPIRDCPDAKLYERYDPEARLYFVAKSGMLVEAVIMPSKPDAKELLDNLNKITRELTAQVETEETEEIV